MITEDGANLRVLGEQRLQAQRERTQNLRVLGEEREERQRQKQLERSDTAKGLGSSPLPRAPGPVT